MNRLVTSSIPAILSVASMILAISIPAGAVTIDNFEEATFILDATAGNDLFYTQTDLLESNVIGTQRNIFMYNYEGDHDLGAVAGSGSVALYFENGSDDTWVDFYYNGGTNAMSRDLTAGYHNAFNINVTSSDIGADLAVSVGTHVGEAEASYVGLSQTISGAGIYQFLYEDFTGTGTPDFSDVDQITVSVTKTDNDIRHYYISDISTATTYQPHTWASTQTYAFWSQMASWSPPTGTPDSDWVAYVSVPMGGQPIEQSFVDQDYTVHGLNVSAGYGTMILDVVTGRTLTVEDELNINGGIVRLQADDVTLEAGEVYVHSGTLYLDNPDAEIHAGIFEHFGPGAFIHYDGTLTVDGGYFSAVDSGSGFDYTIDGNDASDTPIVKLVNGAHFQGGGDASGHLLIGKTQAGVMEARDPGTFVGVDGFIQVGGYYDNSNNGTGHLLITDGATSMCLYTLIGDAGESSGSVLISGEGSMLTVNGFLSVGHKDQSSGQLTILQQAHVISATSYVGELDEASGSVVVAADWTVTDSLYIGCNQSSLGGQGYVSVLSDGEVNVTNLLRLWGAATLDMQGGTLTAHEVDNRGVIEGEGTISVDIDLNNHGTVSPGGFGAGWLTIDGEYEQETDGELWIGIGGTSDEQYDHLVTGGEQAILRGELEVRLINSYLPSVGESFTIITASNIIGTFAVEDLPDLGASLAFDVVYNADNVTLQVISLPIPGDLNGDGFVGLIDLDIILNNWNQTVPPADPFADPSGDGYVGLDDLDIVLNNWNVGTPPVNESTIPEPVAGLSLCALGMTVLSRRGNSDFHI